MRWQLYTVWAAKSVSVTDCFIWQTFVRGCNCRIFVWYLCSRSHNSFTMRLATHVICLLVKHIQECRKATSRIGKWRHSGGQPVGKGQVVNICTSAPFPRREEYAPVPNVCQMRQLWGSDLTTSSCAGRQCPRQFQLAGRAGLPLSARPLASTSDPFTAIRAVHLNTLRTGDADLRF